MSDEDSLFLVVDKILNDKLITFSSPSINKWSVICITENTNFDV